MSQLFFHAGGRGDGIANKNSMPDRDDITPHFLQITNLNVVSKSPRES